MSQRGTDNNAGAGLAGLTILLAALTMVGPLAIDIYLPSLPALAREFGAGPLLMQQTLSLFLGGFSFMMLFYGTLADSFGRRPVVLASLLVYVCASFGAALAPGIVPFLLCRVLQGLAAGAGSVIARAVVRDRVDGARAQRMLSYMMMVYAVAPALAPIAGGWMQLHLGWRAVFCFLGLFGAVMLAVCHAALPESLAPAARQPFVLRRVLTNYGKVLRHGGFVQLALAASAMATGFALYIGSAAHVVVDILHLPVTAFAWLCLPMVGGSMLGASLVARLAHRVAAPRMVALGFAVMLAAALANVAYNWLVLPAAPAVPWAVAPLLFYTLGRGLATPGLTVLGLDLFPDNRALASSLQSFIQMLVFALVVGLLAPLLMGSALRLAAGMLGGVAAGIACWRLYRVTDAATDVATDLAGRPGPRPGD